MRTITMSGRGLAWFQFVCACILFLSSRTEDCTDEMYKHIDELDMDDMLVLSDRSGMDTLIVITVIEALLIAGLTYQTVGHVRIGLQVALVAMLTLIRIRRGGFFGQCLEHDMCCNDVCNQQPSITSMVQPGCSVAGLPLCQQQSSPSNLLQYCPIPLDYYCAGEGNLRDIPDYRHCHTWGCSYSISPVRSVFKWVTTGTVLCALFII